MICLNNIWVSFLLALSLPTSAPQTSAFQIYLLGAVFSKRKKHYWPKLLRKSTDISKRRRASHIEILGQCLMCCGTELQMLLWPGFQTLKFLKLKNWQVTTLLCHFKKHDYSLHWFFFFAMVLLQKNKTCLHEKYLFYTTKTLQSPHAEKNWITVSY